MQLVTCGLYLSMLFLTQLLLDIYKSGTTNRRDIYRQFWSVESIYGLGDKELDIYLEKLGIQ